MGSKDSDRKLWVVLHEVADLQRGYQRNNEEWHYGIHGFQVFEVYLGTETWKEIKNLANRSIFLSPNFSLSLDVSSNRHCKPNCIYFTYDYYMHMHEDEHTELFGDKDMGIYNLEDGRVKPMYKGHYSYHRLNPAMWVERSFL